MNFKNDDELVKYLAVYIRERWDLENLPSAIYFAGTDGDEVAARKTIEQYLQMFEEGRVVPTGGIEDTEVLLQLNRLLERALSVDMAVPPAGSDRNPNRKGALPKALGLVGSNDGAQRKRDLAVYFTFDHARYETGEANRTYERCAELVTRAIELSNVPFANEKLTEENVTKIYQRMSETT